MKPKSENKKIQAQPSDPIRIVIFGGAGFVGLHFSRFLLSEVVNCEIILSDIHFPEFLKQHSGDSVLLDGIRKGKIHYVHHDIRLPWHVDTLPKKQIDLIISLVVLHPTERHHPKSCFEHHIQGMENICAYATAINCQQLVMLSTTDVYGSNHKVKKTEQTPPIPESVFASTLLTAEGVCQRWQQTVNKSRQLLITRTCDVYGHNDHSFVSKIKKALKWQYFCYRENKSIEKASIYIDELCHALWWIVSAQKMGEQASSILFNGVSEQMYSTTDYVCAMLDHTNTKRRYIPNLPYRIWLKSTKKINELFSLCCLTPPINLKRMDKVITSDCVTPDWLKQNNYPWKYDLNTSLAHWKTQFPNDFNKWRPQLLKHKNEEIPPLQSP